MASKSKGVEKIVFNGYTYRRYPESSNPAHRRYFGRAGHRLHRDVWEFYNGPISKGMQVHHIDGNTANNDISNLACVTRDEHWDEHKARFAEFGRSEKQMQHLESIRSKAAAWHRSEAGRAWHREHAKRTIAKTWGAPRVYEETAFNCAWCGKEAKRKSVRRIYCGSACQTAESKFRLGKSSYEHPHHAACVRSDGGG